MKLQNADIKVDCQRNNVVILIVVSQLQKATVDKISKDKQSLTMKSKFLPDVPKV